MTSCIKYYLLILCYALTYLSDTNGEIILTEDKEYDVINFKIPHDIWQKAIRPTPILKSAVTVTLPVSLGDEDFNEVENEEEAEVNVAEIADDTAAGSVTNDETSIVTQAAPPQAVEVIEEEVPGTITSPQNENPIFGQAFRFPCSCIDGQCGCCTGSIMERFKMKACGNISFIPEDFVFDVRMSINDNTVARQRVSASDPPPICFNPRRVPFVRVCAEISNIRIQNQNAFACLDINADIADFPIYSASFRCFGLGTSGVQTNLKPKPQTGNGPKPINLFGNGGGEEDGGILENAAQEILGGNRPGVNTGPFGGFGGIFGSRNHLKTKHSTVVTPK